VPVEVLGEAEDLMAVVGRACLIIAFVVTLYGIGAAIYGSRPGNRRFAESARRSVYAIAGLVTFSFAILEIAFLRSDFSFVTVVTHSSTTTPFFYKAAAAWSSQEGSLLLWAFLLSVWSSVVLTITRNRLRDVTPYATAVLLGFAAFFIGLLVFTNSPFDTVAGPAPAEGSGLNPLLRHPSMMTHPIALYSGYTLAAVPFAFAIGALIARRIDAEWIAATRRFALGSWLALGIGLLLGARWSYVELGWGGYWAWDPVENAALLPWLTATALIHSVQIQEKRGMLKIWNVSLTLATGTLAIVGTFLVRSGILDSIHAFVEQGNEIAWMFTGLICIMCAASIALVVSRRALLASENRIESLLSREAVFLMNNLVLVALTFVVFWGTFFPLISEALTGSKHALGPPWFAKYVVPLTIILAVLSGIGPVLSWRRATALNARRNFAIPLLIAAGAVVLSLELGAGRRPAAELMFAACAFLLGCVGQEFWRGARARRAMTGEVLPVALVSLVRRNRRRYGGYLVHAGVALLFVGLAASSAFQHVTTPTLQVGQTARIAGYAIHYDRPTATITTKGGRLEKINLGSDLTVRQGKTVVTHLHTERGYYPTDDNSLGVVSRYFEGEQTSEVGLKAGARRDIWTVISPDTDPLRPIISQGDKVFGQAKDLNPTMGAALLGQAIRGIVNRYERNPPPAQFRFIISPLVSWIWWGALVILFGGAISIWPPPGGATSRVRARYLARVGRESAATTS
jgi:cytochrome c-type biogenesis protein CcmF